MAESLQRRRRPANKQTKGFRPGPNRRAPERILVYGEEKLGKSSCWLDIAVELHKTGADSVMYVVDTDGTWEILYDEGYGYLEDEGYIVPYHPVDMSDALAIAKEIKDTARPLQDWIVVDMLDWFWEEAQNMYIREVHGNDPMNYFLQMRAEVKEAKKEKKGHKAEYGGQEGMDWQFITKVYRDWEDTLLGPEKTRAHKLMVTGVKKLDINRGATPEDIKKYKVVGGVKPSGQKGVGHRCNTLLRFKQKQNGQRQVVMVADRGRESSVWPEKIGSRTLDIDEFPAPAFAKRYLKGIAGWVKKDAKGEAGKKQRKPRSGSSSRSGSGSDKPSARTKASQRGTRTRRPRGTTRGGK